MENNHLSRRVDNIKSENSDVLDGLVAEIEELEEAKQSLETRVEELENRVIELEYTISEQNDIINNK